jgi:spore coat polysaccharide biosynthesis protein SpsF
MHYTSNTLRRTYPHGLDVEVFGFGVLGQAFNEAKEYFEREHATPYIYRSGKFNIQNIEAGEELKGPDIRITIDTREDYIVLCTIYDFLYHKDPFFGATEIVELFRTKPWLKCLNKNVEQKKIYDNLEDELEETVRILDSLDLRRARDFLKRQLGRMSQ